MAVAKAKRLKTFVHVQQDDGSFHVYGPDDKVPAEDAKRIGDHAWTDEKADDDESPAG